MLGQSQLKHYIPTPGYQALFTPGEGGLEHLHFGVLHLSAGQSMTFAPQPGCEAALTILTGTLDAMDGDQQWNNLGRRQTVFDGPTDALFLPPNNSMTLQGRTDCEIAVAQATSDLGGPVTLYSAQEASVQRRGRPGWQREVLTYLSSGNNEGRLILGETINAAGQWSSFPPHKHDRDNLPIEAEMEEIYLFKLDPPTGFAFQGLYTPDDETTANQAFIVRNDDVVAIPRGYHPVAPAPGHRVCYFWVLAGVGHDLKFYTEDGLRWLEPGL